MDVMRISRQDVQGERQRVPFGEQLIGALLVVAGLGTFAIWIGYLAGNAFGQFPQGLFVYQDGNYPIFHVVAEGLMGVAALVAGGGLWRGTRWGRGLAMLALGMLGYSAINSSGWPLKNDPALLIPMVATLVLVIGAFPYLLRQTGGPEREASTLEGISR
jgi:hypothetical protein